MTRIIQIKANNVKMTAELNDTSTADAIWDNLPIRGRGNRWGDEIYFSIPIQLPEAEDARRELDIGDLAYWPAGNGFCIFFGPTPVSHGDEPRAYSKVNPFGRLMGDATEFRRVNDGEELIVQRQP